MVKYLKNLFGTPEQRRLNKFHATEDNISSILAGTDIVQLNFSESQEREGKHRSELNAIQAANPDLQVSDKNVENVAAGKRLKRRKWFTVIIEAILAISAVKLFFSETVNVNLSAGTAGSSGFAPLFWPALMGLGLAYVVLNEAISYKIDDMKKVATRFTAFWNRFSWFIPLTLIPFLNLYNIFSHPENPTNIIWFFFAALSIWLNIKCAGYAKQYSLMQNTAIAEKKAQPERDGLKKEAALQAKINRNMLRIKRELMKPAADLKRIYLSFGDNKPELNLHPLFCILLNNRFYLYQLLPIHDIEIMNPPKDMSDYLTFWDQTTRVQISYNPVAENIPITAEQVPPMIDNEVNRGTENPTVVNNHANGSNTATAQPATNTVSPAPDFMDVLSNEDEIYV